MKQLQKAGPLLLLVIALSGHACAADLTPAQKQLVADLKKHLAEIGQEIDQATQDDAAYSGGLIKALIGVRLELLKTNAALIEQRIHALEAGARINLVVNTIDIDPARAAELAREIEAQKVRVAEARSEADRYSGGLVHAMAETTVATARNTLAMLEQQYFIARYGLALPSAASEAAPASTTDAKVAAASSEAAPATEPPSRLGAGDCLKIETFDSSVLSTNDVFMELAWKVDVSNSCVEPFSVRVTFTIYDRDEFELDSDSEDVYVPATGTGKARGKMLVSPPEKARRMARQGASLALR